MQDAGEGDLQAREEELGDAAWVRHRYGDGQEADQVPGRAARGGEEEEPVVS
ncbi:hypothetical protein D3C86_2240480 [compost metagenome]